MAYRKRKRTIRKRSNVRRTKRRTSRKGHRRIISTTTRNSYATSVRPLSRKLPIRSWRRLLWSTTQMRTKYRSIRDEFITINMGLWTTGATLGVLQPNGTFWLPIGGLQQHDVGQPVDNFSGDLIIRGGITKLVLSLRPRNTGGVPNQIDSVRVTVFMVWTNKIPVIPGTTWPTNVISTWSPDIVPDFQIYGRVVGRKECLLKDGGEGVEIIYRHKVQKVDQAVHVQNGGRLNFFIVCHQTSNGDGTGEAIDCILSHNLTFCGDVE